MARATLWTAGGMAASAVTMFAAGLYMVAAAKPAHYADVAILTVAVGIVGNLLRFGADRITVPEVRNAAGVNEEAALAKAADLLAFSVVVGVLGAAASCLPGARHGWDFPLSQPLSPLELAAVATWLVADVVRLVASEVHRSQYAFGMAAFAGYGMRAPLFLAVLIAEGLIQGGLDRAGMIYAACGASVLICFISLARLPAGVRWWRGQPIASGKSLWRGHVTMVLTTIAASLIGGADIWIVGSMTGAGMAATYALAVTLVSGMAMLAAALTGGVAPFLSSAVTEGRYGELKPRLIKAMRIAAALALLAYLGLVLTAKPLAVRLGGPAYGELAIFVAILGAGQIVNALAGIPGAVLIAARRYPTLAVITVSVSAAFLVLQAVAGYVLDSVRLVAVFSASATAALPVVGCIVLATTMRLRSDVFAR